MGGRILVLFLTGLAAVAQVPTGGVEGVVLDPSGAVVAGAAVSLVEDATGRKIALSTNELGRYSAGSLLPGSYTLRVSAAGFSVHEIRGLAVETGSAVTANVSLELGALEQVVSVRASNVGVDLVRHTIDTVITQNDIESLPLSSRNFLDFASLAPGVSVTGGAVLDPTKTYGYRAVGVSGRRGGGTRIQIDGIDVTDAVSGSTLVNVSSDAIQEFQLSRSSADVSAPMTSSGAVAVTTRSGGNDVHGRAFLDFYNQRMAARPGYESKSSPFHQTRTGVTAGGPFVKDRLFWFVNWDRTYAESLWLSPSPLWPQLEVTSSVPSGLRYLYGRVDWNARPGVRLFYGFASDWNSSIYGGLRTPYSNVNWGAQHTLGLDAAGARWTHSNRFGFVNYNNRIESRELGLAFPRTPQGIPYYLYVGSYSLGPSANAPQKTGESSLQNHYTASVLWGRQTVRFGASVDALVMACVFGPSGLRVGGSYTAAIVSQIRARSGNPQDPLEYPLSSFSMALLPYLFGSRGGHGFPLGAQYDKRFGFYLSDSIKASRRLSLNLGLRHDYATGYFGDSTVKREPLLETWIAGASAPPRLPKSLFSPTVGFAWDPAGNGATVVRGGFTRRYESNLKNNSDEPAMLPVAFGGYAPGMSFLSAPDGTPFNIDGKHPAGNYVDWQGRRIGDVIGSIGEMERALMAAYSALKLDPASGPSAFAATRGATGPVFPGNQYKIPYSLQFNLGVQRGLGRETLLAVDYVHNHAVGLPRLTPDLERGRDSEFLNVEAARAQINRVLADRNVDDWIAAVPGRNISAFNLITDSIWPGRFPDFLYANFYVGGFSTYRALQVSFRGRASRFGPLRDAVWFTAYTLSRIKASNAAPNAESWYGNGSIRDNRNWNSRVNFGPTSLDRTHGLSFRSVFTVAGGFRLGSVWTFGTAGPASLSIPSIGTATTGSNSIFATDLDGDAVADLVPGVGAGQFGRKVKSLAELNRIIGEFNGRYAGTLTAHGRALVNAGLFTEAQLKRLGAVVPTIPAVPETNPTPWHNLLYANVKVERAIRIAERVWLRPFATINNVFNHAPSGLYSGLAGTFGALNFDYAAAPPGNQVSDLTRIRGRIAGTRLVQVGMRVDF